MAVIGKKWVRPSSLARAATAAQINLGPAETDSGGVELDPTGASAQSQFGTGLDDDLLAGKDMQLRAHFAEHFAVHFGVAVGV